MKDKLKLAWGFAVLWLLPIAAISLMLSPAIGPLLAAVVALHAWSIVLLLVLLPQKPSRAAQLAGSMMLAVALAA